MLAQPQIENLKLQFYNVYLILGRRWCQSGSASGGTGSFVNASTRVTRGVCAILDYQYASIMYATFLHRLPQLCQSEIH